MCVLPPARSGHSFVVATRSLWRQRLRWFQTPCTFIHQHILLTLAPNNPSPFPIARGPPLAQMAVLNLADDAVLFRPSTVTAIAPVWSSSAPRFNLSRMSLIAASIITLLAEGLKKTEIV
eukprot:scaffold49717_cov70-Phaeocystis_antarctica.AAC.3